MAQKTSKQNNIGIYDYDKRIARTWNIINKELSKENIKIIEQYYKAMVIESLAKPTLLKHLQTLLNLTRFLKIDWKDAKKEDIESVVAEIVQTYLENGQETNSTQ